MLRAIVEYILSNILYFLYIMSVSGKPTPTRVSFSPFLRKAIEVGACKCNKNEINNKIIKSIYIYIYIY